MRKFMISAAAALVCGAIPAMALAQMVERPGRYAMQPVEGGFARLDTDTGAVSLCVKRGAEFSCQPVADERGQQQKEIDRLKAENLELQHRLADAQAGKDKRLDLPSEEDVDKALNYMERLVKKFRDKMRELEGSDGGGKGKGTPL